MLNDIVGNANYMPAYSLLHIGLVLLHLKIKKDNPLLNYNAEVKRAKMC
jgi:hypothetical protein